MNILDFYKVNNFLNKYFGFSFPTLKNVVAKCLKLIWNHSGIISGAYFSPFQGVYILFRGLRRAPKPNFGLILDFSIIFLIFFAQGYSLWHKLILTLLWLIPFIRSIFAHICAIEMRIDSCEAQREHESGFPFQS